MSYKETRQRRLFHLEGLTNVYEYPVGRSKEETNPSHRTRGNGHEMKYRNLHLNTRRILVGVWLSFGTGWPEGVVSLSLEADRISLNMILGSLL